MALKVKYQANGIVDIIHKESIQELNEFYEKNYDTTFIKVFLIEDRQTYNILMGKETHDWMKGFSSGRNAFTFDLDAVEKETNGYHKKDINLFKATIKHEIAHCYFRLHTNGMSDKFPVSRLNEGMSIYLAGQLKFKREVTHFEDFLDFWEHGAAGVYKESGFVIKILIDKYGKDKILKLIESIKNIESNQDLYKNFLEIFGWELTYDNINKLNANEF